MIELLERPDVRRHIAPLSVDAYHRPLDLGLGSVRSELVNGVSVEKMTRPPLHALILHRLLARLAQGLPARHSPRKEDPLTLAALEPETDIAIVAGSIERE